MQSTIFGTVTMLILLVSLSVVFAEEFGKLEFGGKYEGEFGYVMAEGDDESDFSMAKAELEAQMRLAPNVSGHALFLYEQGKHNDNVTVEEGTVDLKLPVKPFQELSLSLGVMIVPFGEFNSHFVSDPFTKDIGETRHGALRLAASHEIVNTSVAFYNGKVDVEGSNNAQISDMAARVAFSLPEAAFGKGMTISLGASFITNVAEAGDLHVLCASGVSERCMGSGGFICLGAMGVFLEGEVITALGDIESLDGMTLKPRAFNVELGYSLPGIPVEIAGRFEQLSEDGDNSTDRFGGVVSIGLFKKTASLAIEFLRTSNSDSAYNSIGGQLAAGF